MTMKLHEMYDPFDWMYHADVYILNFLNKHQIVANPVTIAENLDYDHTYVNRRCKALSDAGLLERTPNRGLYSISDLGEEFIEDGLSDEDIAALEGFGQADNGQ